MSTSYADTALAQIAAAIAEPARARILCCLLDGQARTSTELAIVAEVSPSTTSVHLARLLEQHLIRVLPQGKYRYYQLAGKEVAIALESLLVVADAPRANTTLRIPPDLRYARTCYDHLAGTLGVQIHDHMYQEGWIDLASPDSTAYNLTPRGTNVLQQVGIDWVTLSKKRRRFAYACVDWSERCPHLGGALGAALLQKVLQSGWVERDLTSRVLYLTSEGRYQLQKYFHLNLTQE